MCDIKEKFKEYQQNLSSDFLGYKDVSDFFYHKFMEISPVDDDKEIRKGFEKLNTQIEFLSIDNNNIIFNLIEELCLMHTEKSFRSGFSIGMKVAMELQNLMKTK